MRSRSLSLICGLVVVAGCDTSHITSSAPQPVSVDVVFWGGVLEVGSVSRVCALGMASWGVAVATHPVQSWTLSDSTLAGVTPAPDPADRAACVLLHPVRPGTLSVTARMSGIDGTGGVRIIPAIGSVSIAPSMLTLKVGDTATVTPTVISTSGDTLRNLPMVWRASDAGRVASVVFYGVGAAARSVVQGNAAGQNSVTAEVATSRQDSATNVRGQAAVSVGP